MRRYWIEKPVKEGSYIWIEGEEFHHIFHVCRREKGHKFELLLGDGKAHLVEVTQKEKKKAKVQILEEREIPPLKKPYLHLALSVPKISTFESILEKSVELGIKEVHPFLSDYSHFKTSEHKALAKNKRWQRIIKSATQQSGRAEKMALSEVMGLEKVLEVFNQKAQARGLIAYEGESSLMWKEAISGLHNGPKEEIWLFIGSEGGFSSQEVKKFHQMGLSSMTMGEQVLRVETACVALVGSLKYELEI